jgi:hypothetical protein
MTRPLFRPLSVSLCILLLAACSSNEEEKKPEDASSPSPCANLPAERIDTIEFNPKTDCGDAGADGGSCDCTTLCKQRIGSDVVSCTLVAQNKADCAVKVNCPR